ncbi:Lysine--tRNA ligase [Candidatus Hepatincolaceae symbiont of Richtersius coronifer]
MNENSVLKPMKATNMKVNDLRNHGEQSKAWPFVEARKILERLDNKVPNKGYVLFETGYGPSGLPHIGTFGEVARTSMVRFAFEQISDIPTKLIAFSDDMDGLRKVPTNIPNQDKLKPYLGMPLTKVPDPFDKFNSFGEHNNAMLRNFLDNFGFQYDFYSSTQCYKNGMFDEALLQVLKNYQSILDVILPTLGDERRSNYSPFLPICPKTGKVLQAQVIAYKIEQGTIVYLNEDGEKITTEVTGGKCKLQWKVDWGMRWYALDVNYEMSGKDLIPSVVLASKVCNILGKIPPINLTYELFLDQNGEKISKSKGNGLSIEQWLKYGNKESLAYYMYQKPQTAKRLYFDSIPTNVDNWLVALNQYEHLEDNLKVESPIFFIHKNQPQQVAQYITFALLLNLIAVISTVDKGILLGYINKYKKLNKATETVVNDLLDYAINYYNDFIKPKLQYKTLSPGEKQWLSNLKDELAKLSEEDSAETIQNVVYKIGKTTDIELKEWFRLLYQSILGQDEGPRIGSFFALYGLNNSLKLLDQLIARSN